MIEKTEIWKDIPEYEGLYQISNFGRLKSLERTIICQDGSKITYKSKLFIWKYKYPTKN